MMNKKSREKQMGFSDAFCGNNFVEEKAWEREAPCFYENCLALAPVARDNMESLLIVLS